jgi:FkbM family methyltransferase
MNNLQKFKITLKKYFPGIIYPILGRKNSYLYDRSKILEHLKIDTLFDIGANIGQYGHTIRHFNFNGKIVSFEPMKNAFENLKSLSENDSNWLVRNYGLGDSDTELTINISENSVSSSLLEDKPKLGEMVPATRYIAKEKVVIKRLDSIIDEFCDADSKLFVKIDAQGFEPKILDGCKGCMDRILGFQLELPFIELYKGEKTFFEMTNLMDTFGFKLIALEPGWNDPKTGFAVEVDGIFVKK